MNPRVRFSLAVFTMILCLISLQVRAQTDQSNRQLTQGGIAQSQTSQRRIALVIGNGAYQHAGRLANPPNDATLVAATLRQLGFEVKNGSNLTQREMKQRIREFGQTLRANGAVGLFYFAGHGVQAKGRNYLMPVDADVQTEADLEDVAVDLNYVLNLMDDAQNALNIVVLDACRNNPFARSFRSAQEGLAQVKAPTGTLIAYATAPDSIAADGTGTNSPYTQELIKQMQSSGVLVETMFRRVTERVSSRTNGKQEPWFSANVKGDFYFTGSPTNPSTTNLSLSNSGDTSISKLDPAAIELSYWDSIKNSTNADDFKAYLEKYPDGQFAALAKNRITSLETSGKSESRSSASGDATEIAFWDSIKNRNQAEDFQAYLKKYPNGEFRDLAKNRLDTLREKESADYHLNLAKTLLEQKKDSEAEAEAREALRLAPNHSYGHDLLGVSLIRQKRYPEAEKSLREAVRLAPDVAPYRYNLGVALTKQGRHAEAEAEFKEAVRLNPAEADVPTFFKGTYGIGGFGSAFNPVTLRVWGADDIFFLDEPDDGQGWKGNCSQFVGAHIKGSSIYDIRSEDGSYKKRFNAESPSAAASALDSIQAACKGK